MGQTFSRGDGEGLWRATTLAPLPQGKEGAPLPPRQRPLPHLCPPVAMVTLWRVVARGPGPGSHAPRLQGQKAADREDE